jgi:transcriptional regulator with XRE-family HTH domain
MDTVGDRIKKARVAKDLSKAELARLVGVVRQAVTLWENNTAEPTAANLRKLAVILDCSYDWLATGRDASLYFVTGVELRGEIAAGVWVEIPENHEMEYERVPVAPDPSYPSDAQYALRVRGTSVDRVAKDGSIIVCVDIMAAGIEVRNNDLVVVERRRGSIVETTVKRLRKGKGGLELWPESDDPAHQEKLTLGHRRGDEIAVKAVVISVLSLVPRGN